MKILYNIDKARWDSFFSSFEDPAILQSYEWGELKSLHGWKVMRIAVLIDGEVVSAASILKRKLPLGPFYLFYAPRGIIWKVGFEDAFKLLLAEIKSIAFKEGGIVLKIDPQIREEDSKTKKILTENGFKYSPKQIQPRATFILDLTKSLEEIKANFEEKTRYNIKLASKKGVEVKEESTDEGVETFYSIYQETAKRDNFLVHQIKYYRNIKKLIIDEGMSKIFTAYYKGEAIASVWTFNFGKKIWYMYGASLSKARNVMPNHALHWAVILYAKENGFESYDFFGIPSNPRPDHPLWGVYKFKKGFGGEVVKYIGVYDLPIRPIIYIFLEYGISLYKNIRSLILKGKISDSLDES